MGLREVGSCLPPGFRFHPSDEELVGHYLYKKVSNKKVSEGVTMVEVDLHTKEPWELPEVAKLSANEWYFFSFRDRKYATGSRTNRATKSGYWKATGKDRTVYNHRKHAMIGMRKTLVFYIGRAPNGTKTDWVMHEFRIQIPHSAPKEDWVLCRVFHKKKEERVKETTTNCYTSISPSTIWHSSSPIVLDQTLSSYPEEFNINYTHNNSFMEFNPIHDFTYDYNMKIGQKNGNDEHNALLWDTGLEYVDDIINMERIVFLK